LPQVSGQQQLLIHVIRTKRFAHTRQFTDSKIAVYDFFPTDSGPGSALSAQQQALKGKARTTGIARSINLRLDGGAEPRLTSGGEAGVDG
jgi:hypothetical protein